ncbi:hypothetical protein CC2G_010999 [Coprinopsis cinerea AmutBmut pab1-1]|nr:hypothetical protein CC2G_010999 [Coprinopsis cinerea AmutBmut pab1-1]
MHQVVGELSRLCPGQARDPFQNCEPFRYVVQGGFDVEDLKLFELGLPDQTIALAISFGCLSTSESERVLAYKEECKARIIALAQSVKFKWEPVEDESGALPKVILLEAATYDEYRKIQRRMQVCDALLSDVRSLPSDILDEILTHFLWIPPVEPWSGTFQTRQHKDEGVMQAHRRDTFRRVCRLWNVAALSNLEHWSPMEIEWCSDLRRQAVDAPSAGGSSRLRGGQRRFPFFDRRLESAYLSKLDLFDALAYPWSLLLHGLCKSRAHFNKKENGTTPHLEPLEKLLNHPAFAKLKKLEIRNDALSQVGGLDLSQVSFPNVESFVWSGTVMHPPCTLPFIPKVTKVVIDHYPTKDSFKRDMRLSDVFSLERLTHLYMGNGHVMAMTFLTLSTWLYLMEACISLERGSFSINDDGRREASADEENRVWEINQPYLTHLVIYSSSRFNIPTNPRWPSLKTFKLILPMFEYMQTLQFGWHGAIQSFNMATLDSFRYLNHLTLDGDIQTGRFATEIVPFLEAAPQLTELFLRLLCQDNDEVVRSLVWDCSSGPPGCGVVCLPGVTPRRLLPNLEAFGFYFHRNEFEFCERFIPADALVALVESRHRAIVNNTSDVEYKQCSPLRSLVIRLEHSLQEETRLELQIVASRLRQRLAPYTKDANSLLTFGYGEGVSGHRIKLSVVPTLQDERRRGGNDGAYFDHWDDGFLDFTENGPAYSPYAVLEQSEAGRHDFMISPSYWSRNGREGAVRRMFTGQNGASEALGI